MVYLYLALAIITEVLGTGALKASDGFSKPLPSIFVILGYGLAFFFFGLVLRSMPIGIAYAIWSGMGIVLLTIVGLLFFEQKIDIPGIIGITLIIAGVVILNVYSRSVNTAA